MENVSSLTESKKGKERKKEGRKMSKYTCNHY